MRPALVSGNSMNVIALRVPACGWLLDLLAPQLPPTLPAGSSLAGRARSTGRLGPDRWRHSMRTLGISAGHATGHAVRDGICGGGCLAARQRDWSRGCILPSCILTNSAEKRRTQGRASEQGHEFNIHTKQDDGSIDLPGLAPQRTARQRALEAVVED